MIRMEMSCFMVIAFMAVMYFSAKREKNSIHKIFSSLMIVSMINLIFDGITIYTVNHMEIVEAWVNDIAHRLFIGTMVIFFYLVYRYIIAIIEDESKSSIKTSPISKALFVLALGGAAFLPIKYMTTESGGYSYGPAPYMTYASIAVFLVMIVSILIKYWSAIHSKKKMVITIAMSIEVIVSLYQAFNPMALLSGMGIMLINLSFYLLIENPDILLVKQVEYERQKADAANKSKSVFLSHMSHEIRTPMNSVIGMADVLLRTKLDDEQREYLKHIKVSGNALLSIINDILDLSKIEAGKMELAERVYDVYSELDNIKVIIENRIGEKPINLVYDIDDKLPQVLYGDDIRVRQVIINLLNNAVKFTDEGSISLVIRVVAINQDSIKLKVSVRDTGIGIKEEELHKLFDAFEQVDKEKNIGKEGTGLGLSISSQLIELMGGKLGVKSEYGKGSSFYFDIEQRIVSLEEYDKIQKESQIPQFAASKARILIVDDNAMNLKVAEVLLEPLGMQIDVAESGMAALNMIKEKHYDLIFMDHMMPVMDGIETTRIIRELSEEYYTNVPIIALTANAMVDVQQAYFEAGMNDVLIKPIDMDMLARMLLKWLPAKHIEYQTIDNKEEDTETDIFIENIDVKEGIKNSGGTKLFIDLLGDFYTLIDSKTNKIRKCLMDGLVKDYTIEVHALKNSARLIGAMELSDKFAYLEKLGNAGDVEELNSHTEDVLELYNSYKSILKPYGKKHNQRQKLVSNEEILTCIEGINRSIREFDIDAADDAMRELEGMVLPEACTVLMDKLRVYMADVAMEDIITVTDEMINVVKA